MSEIKNTQSNLSIVLKKMKDTLDALADAFDDAMSADPIDTTYNQIKNASEDNNKKKELVN